MINVGILQQQMLQKFQTLGLHCVVNECFIGALPLEKSAITNDDKKMLTRYSYAVLEQLGGFSVLEQAMLSENLNDHQRLYLADVYNICTESASETSKRICAETDCTSNKTKLSEIMDTAAMTDQEYKTFVSKANSLDLEKVSEVIKKKTLNVLKEEKEKMEKDNELDEELKNALAESKDVSDGVTTEAYLDMFLDKCAAKHPVSLFSKLNDVAMEAMEITPVSDVENIGPILYRTTFEGFLPELNQLVDIDHLIAQEGHVGISTEECCPVPNETRSKVGLLVSTVVYTIMETLKTLNLYCPSKNTITNFVNKEITHQQITETSREFVLERASKMQNYLNSTDISKKPSKELSELATNIQSIVQDLQKILENNLNDSMASQFLVQLDQRAAAIYQIIDQRTGTKTVATESYYDKRNKSEVIAGFNHVNSVMGQHPHVSEIVLKVDPNIPSFIAVEGLNAQHIACKKSHIYVNAAVESSQYVQYLADAYRESNLSSTKKNVFIQELDGRGNKIAL